MFTKALLTLALTITTTFADDCIGKDGWENGPQCIQGNGGDLTKELVNDLVTCMQLHAYGSDDGHDIHIKGNGVVPDFGDGAKVSWSKDGFEMYMINTKKDGVCVNALEAAKTALDGYEDGCININWSTGDYWDAKMGVAKCDAVYGCDNTSYESTKC